MSSHDKPWLSFKADKNAKTWISNLNGYSIHIHFWYHTHFVSPHLRYDPNVEIQIGVFVFADILSAIVAISSLPFSSRFCFMCRKFFKEALKHVTEHWNYARQNVKKKLMGKRTGRIQWRTFWNVRNGWQREEINSIAMAISMSFRFENVVASIACQIGKSCEQRKKTLTGVDQIFCEDNDLYADLVTCILYWFSFSWYDNLP